MELIESNGIESRKNKEKQENKLVQENKKKLVKIKKEGTDDRKRNE